MASRRDVKHHGDGRLLADGCPLEYNDLGSDHFDRQDKTKTIRRLLKRLHDLGCEMPQLFHAT